MLPPPCFNGYCLLELRDYYILWDWSHQTWFGVIISLRMFFSGSLWQKGRGSDHFDSNTVTRICYVVCVKVSARLYTYHNDTWNNQEIYIMTRYFISCRSREGTKNMTFAFFPSMCYRQTISKIIWGLQLNNMPSYFHYQLAFLPTLSCLKPCTAAIAYLKVTVSLW